MPQPKKGARLGGSPAHQKLMLANLAKSLFEHDKITTTEAKARLLRPYAERLITLSTSAVAVCCWSDSDKSRVRACTSSNRRAFSMAITAWSAKVSSSLICAGVNGRTSLRRAYSAPMSFDC